MHRSSVGVAAAHGLPIVTTRGKQLERLFLDGVNVLLCPPRDSSALAARINRLIADRELQERLSRGARAVADEHFSWERCMEQTLEAFTGAGSSERGDKV